MSQLSLSLNDVLAGASRKRDAKSAKDAARTCNADAQKQQILRLLAANTQGMTADELAVLMRPSPHRSSVAARLAQLADERNGSLVYPFGIRLNHRNRPVQIWHLRYQPRVTDVPTGNRL